jgi:putative spermidine/putrescine transport system ATP-binding protein
MSDGAVRQVGTQQELYERPADRFVAGFVGRSNLLAGTMAGPGRFETAGGIAIACVANGAPGPGVIALRPERLVLGPAAAGLDNRLSGTVELVSYLGSSIDVHVRVSSGDRVVVSQPNRADGRMPKEGDTIDVGWSREAAVVLPDNGAAGQTGKEEHR